MHAEQQRTAAGPRVPGSKAAAAAQPRRQHPAAEAMLALQRAAGNAAVTQAVQRAPWKNQATKNAHKAAKTQDPGNPVLHTLHHIVSKSLLKEFALNLSAADAQLVAAGLGFGTITPAALGDRLMNFPANFVAGPDPATRVSDPGNAIDPNYDDEGAVTPRSEHLGSVNTFLGLQKAAGWPQITPAQLTSDFIAPMRAAAAAHGPGAGISTARTRWSPDGSGKWQRPQPLEPLV